VVRALVLREVQDKDAFPLSHLVSSDEFKAGEGVQVPVNIQAFTVGKQFTLDALRAILKNPITVGKAPKAHEKQGQHRVFLP
jgi:hypothetical protein